MNATTSIILAMIFSLMTLCKPFQSHTSPRAHHVFSRFPAGYSQHPLVLLRCSPVPKESQSINLDFLNLQLGPSVDESEDESRKTWTARLMLLTVSAFYGTNFGCVKVLDEALDPSVAATLRFSLAALIFFPFLVKKGSNVPKLVLGGLEVGSYCALGYYAQAQALLTASASTVAFLCSLAVLVVPILDIYFSSKSKGKELGGQSSSLLPAFLAAAGVGCLELGGTSLPGVGDLWALLQPLAFGLGFWKTESYMKESKEGDAQVFTGAMMLTVAMFSLLWMSFDFFGPLLGNHAAFNAAVQSQLNAFSDWHVLAAIGWTGIITTALTSFGENVAMKELSAAESTVIYSTEPLWGTAFAAIALGEQIGWNTGVGAFLILSACVWSSLGSDLVVLAGSISAAKGFTSGGIEELSALASNLSRNLFQIFESL